MGGSTTRGIHLTWEPYALKIETTLTIKGGIAGIVREAIYICNKCNNIELNTEPQHHCDTPMQDIGWIEAKEEMNNAHNGEYSRGH